VSAEADVHAIGEPARRAVTQDAAGVHRLRPAMRQPFDGVARRKHLDEVVAAAKGQDAERGAAAASKANPALRNRAARRGHSRRARPRPAAGLTMTKNRFKRP
jgi:hypothetical protein